MSRFTGESGSPLPLVEATVYFIALQIMTGTGLKQRRPQMAGALLPAGPFTHARIS